MKRFFSPDRVDPGEGKPGSWQLETANGSYCRKDHPVNPSDRGRALNSGYQIRNGIGLEGFLLDAYLVRIFVAVENKL